MENQKETKINLNDEVKKTSSIKFLNNKKLMKKGDYSVHVLIEEIRSIIFPFKIYNMINPQETRFYDIIEIYLNKRS